MIGLFDYFLAWLSYGNDFFYIFYEGVIYVREIFSFFGGKWNWVIVSLFLKKYCFFHFVGKGSLRPITLQLAHVLSFQLETPKLFVKSGHLQSLIEAVEASLEVAISLLWRSSRFSNAIVTNRQVTSSPSVGLYLSLHCLLSIIDLANPWPLE